ncbi:hypothetical protein K437DRAFT_258662 [Tilletiaria anomala UBC 951]|uniref:DUF1690-domain-containing protein n=1 Tax=Tilletiaria anomala (strain ATCC 24038 / CBS 436.72 / UBC 951) TaxID=1037660 RepID=A0A066VG49_TILAU|nr:uncharacterized protein K437DRAFT_258662 [Tilletiaria anomala UBC 951]KDN40436.1 hypothetical protein K437DRAFT_258662 [Tilletiaria anomala UBC 951]
MGAAGSKPTDAGSAPKQTEAKSTGAEPLQLGRSLLNDIDKNQSDVAGKSDGSDSSGANKDASPSLLSATRQTQLDASIQSRIKSELSRLKKQENEVRKQIELALEKENLDNEKKLGEKGAQGRSAVLLQQQLDEISQKIEKHNKTREKVENTPGVKQAREEVTKCYRDGNRTLDCWEAVQNFNAAVAKAEKNFLLSASA